MDRTKAYLSRLPAAQRKALQALRQQILSALPGIEEHFGYGMPAFKFRGHPLLYIGAAKDHCALYGTVPAVFKEDLKGFKTSKGSVRFAPEKPLPAGLVEAIVQMKASEIEARWADQAHRTR